MFCACYRKLHIFLTKLILLVMFSISKDADGLPDSKDESNIKFPTSPIQFQNIDQSETPEDA